MEPETYARFVREVNAVGKHIDDPEAFASAVNLIGVWEEMLGHAAIKLYGEGYSYTDIGRPLDMSKQSVSKRWPQISRLWRR
jgi:hypothetical protein